MRLYGIYGDDREGGSEWAIEGVVGGVGILWGPPGIGKSFVAVSMAVSVASGRPWIGRRTSEGRVVYVAGEGGVAAVKRRMHACLSELRHDPEEYLPISVGVPAPDLTRGPQEVIATVGEGPPPKLIIVDTLSRSFSGDENKQEFMAQFVRSLDTLRDMYGASILVIHHANKQGKMRGSTVLHGAADVSWHLTRARGPAGADGRETVMVAEKLRERDTEGAEIRMRLVSVPCRWDDGSPVLDEFGDLQTSLVVQPGRDQMKTAGKLQEIGFAVIKVAGRIEYKEWRDLFPTMGKSEFDAALSMMLTSPGLWGGLWQTEPGVYRLGATPEDVAAQWEAPDDLSGQTSD